MKINALFALSALALLTVGGGPRLAAMTREQAIAAMAQWRIEPYIAQAFRITGRDDERIVRLVGRNFGPSREKVTVAFNGVPAEFILYSGNHIIARRPESVTEDRVQVTVTVGAATSAPEDVTTVWEVADPIELLMTPGEKVWWMEWRGRQGSSMEWGFTSNAFNELLARALDIPEAAFRNALNALKPVERKAERKTSIGAEPPMASAPPLRLSWPALSEAETFLQLGTR